MSVYPDCADWFGCVKCCVHLFETSMHIMMRWGRRHCWFCNSQHTTLLTHTNVLITWVWRAHALTGVIYCLTPRSGCTMEDYVSLFFLSAFSLHPFNPSFDLSVSCPFSPILCVSMATSPSSTPLTYLLKDIWLCLNHLSPSLPACLSPIAIPPRIIILSLCQSFTHLMLQLHRYWSYCAGMLHNPGSIVNGSGANVMHVSIVELNTFSFGVCLFTNLPIPCLWCNDTDGLMVSDIFDVNLIYIHPSIHPR